MRNQHPHIIADARPWRSVAAAVSVCWAPIRTEASAIQNTYLGSEDGDSTHKRGGEEEAGSIRTVRVREPCGNCR